MISDYLFVTEPSGIKNLQNEGIPDSKIFFVGNVMIDTLLQHIKKAEKSRILQDLELRKESFGLITLHRPHNVDDPAVLRGFLEVFQRISRELTMIFPAHPRTQKNIKKLGLCGTVTKVDQIHKQAGSKGVVVTDPIGYLDFLKLMSAARVVLTDSGGIQEETTILQVPCLTLRENTERPITVDVGTNTLVGTNSDKILTAFTQIMANSYCRGAIPDLWDGRAAERIVRIMLQEGKKYIV